MPMTKVGSETPRSDTVMNRRTSGPSLMQGRIDAHRHPDQQGEQSRHQDSVPGWPASFRRISLSTGNGLAGTTHRICPGRRCRRSGRTGPETARPAPDRDAASGDPQGCVFSWPDHAADRVAHIVEQGEGDEGDREHHEGRLHKSPEDEHQHERRSLHRNERRGKNCPGCWTSWTLSAPPPT